MWSAKGFNANEPTLMVGSGDLLGVLNFYLYFKPTNFT